MGLAIITFPSNDLNTRLQLSSQISWKRPKNGRRGGTAEIHLEQAYSALVMLMVGESTVRRQWFLDPTKARNNRLLAVREFDKDLRMIKRAVLDDPGADSHRFERGVAALLFLLGFAPMIQLEKDAPDLVVMTPGGTLAIIECTTKIADFHLKLGKLIDRRGALIKTLSASGHQARVDAFLVCALPRDQISAQQETLKDHQVILIAKDQLESAFEQVLFPSDPDKLLDEARDQLNIELPS